MLHHEIEVKKWSYTSQFLAMKRNKLGPKNGNMQNSLVLKKMLKNQPHNHLYWKIKKKKTVHKKIPAHIQLVSKVSQLGSARENPARMHH